MIRRLLYRLAWRTIRAAKRGEAKRRARRLARVDGAGCVGD